MGGRGCTYLRSDTTWVIDPVPTTKAAALRRAAGVLRATAGERIRRVPSSPDDLTPAWLTQALGEPVRSVNITRRSAGTTTRAALELAYANGATDQMFVKCTTSLPQRLMLGLGGLIHGEPGFYNHIRPGLEIEAPLGYYAAAASRSWRSIVVVEDVAATRGARFWDPAASVTRHQIEDLLGNVARWHGALWDSPHLAGWRWLRTPADQMRLIDALLGLADRRAAGARRARPVIPPALRTRQDDLYAGMRRSMKIASEGPRTYLHGDLHVANTYRTRAGAMGIADWQVGLQGSWASDFAYLLATALEVADRRAWERELLGLYLDALGAAGGPAIPHQDAWVAYRQATFYPYFAWVYTIGRARLQPRFQPERVSLLMIERIAAAIADLESLAAVGL